MTAFTNSAHVSPADRAAFEAVVDAGSRTWSVRTPPVQASTRTGTTPSCDSPRSRGCGSIPFSPHRRWPPGSGAPDPPAGAQGQGRLGPCPRDRRPGLIATGPHRRHPPPAGNRHGCGPTTLPCTARSFPRGALPGSVREPVSAPASARGRGRAPGRRPHEDRIMTGDDHGHARPGRGDQDRPEFLGRRLVELRRGFVEHQEPRPHRQRRATATRARSTPPDSSLDLPTGQRGQSSSASLDRSPSTSRAARARRGRARGSRPRRACPPAGRPARRRRPARGARPPDRPPIPARSRPPSIRTRRPVGSSPTRIRSRVLLPLPDGPRTTSSRPEHTSRSTPHSTRRSP